MAINRSIAGVATPITTLKRRTAAGTWVDLLAENRAMRRVGSAWTDLLAGSGGGGLAVTTNATEAFVVFSCDDPDEPPFVCPTVTTLNTTTITATATGGTGSGPTYAWSYVSGDMGFIPSNPTSASTGWSINIPQNATKSATWKCTATRGVDTDEATVLVTADYIRTGGGTSES